MANSGLWEVTTKATCGWGWLLEQAQPSRARRQDDHTRSESTCPGVPETRDFDTPRQDPLSEFDSLVAGVAKLSVRFNVAELGAVCGF